MFEVNCKYLVKVSFANVPGATKFHTFFGNSTYPPKDKLTQLPNYSIFSKVVR